MYNRYVGDVYRYSLAMLRNPADAEDVTQTTFLNAYRAYARGERPHAAQRWLIAIAHNVCRQRFRQSQRRVEEVAYDDALGDSFVADDDAPSAEDLRRALGHLAFNQRAALVMRELEGRSYAEIAEVLDLSVSAVETLIFRARRSLREQLEGKLTCRDAELAISRQLDGRLPRAERGSLRAHLRECKECATHARRLRAQRTAIKALGLAPLPASLGSFFGGGAAAGGAAAAVGGGLAVKAAGVFAAATVVAGVGHEVSQRSPWKAPEPPVAVASARATPAPPVLQAATTIAAPAESADLRPAARRPVARPNPTAKAQARPVQAGPKKPIPSAVRPTPPGLAGVRPVKPERAKVVRTKEPAKASPGGRPLGVPPGQAKKPDR
jgi:RNA polymerase sigma-70 factor (ECF subfamily)